MTPPALLPQETGLPVEGYRRPRTRRPGLYLCRCRHCAFRHDWLTMYLPIVAGGVCTNFLLTRYQRVTLVLGAEIIGESLD